MDEQRRLFEQLSQLKDDLDRETIDRVARQNEVQTLEEQIAFLKAVHEQEVAELSRLQTIVGFDPAQFYRTELERAIRDIRGDFEQLNTEQKRELEEWYRIKTEEVEKEVGIWEIWEIWAFIAHDLQYNLVDTGKVLAGLSFPFNRNREFSDKNVKDDACQD